MNQPQTETQSPAVKADSRGPALRPPSRWHDPLRLIQVETPSENGRIILWSISCLILILLAWAAFGQLDIIISAEGKLTPQTLLKIVQPSEAGVIKELLVEEGDAVKAGQVLARLDSTVASADKQGISSDLVLQRLQERRIVAELREQPMAPQAGDDAQLFAQVHSQYEAHKRAFGDSLAQEQSLLVKAENEMRSAGAILSKLEQTLPTYKKAAEAYARLEKEGFFGGLASADKQREATEKEKDLTAQQSTVAAANATIVAQQRRINQLQSAYRSDLQKELAEIRARIQQLQPTLDKTLYKEGVMTLRAPQDGVIKDIASTTIGAVVQPGTVVMTLVPVNEQLYADVQIRNEDVGFVQVGQSVQIKLAAYPFQKYGMLSGRVTQVSVDATEAGKASSAASASAGASDSNPASTVASYKARVALNNQTFISPQGQKLVLTPGMQIVAEVKEGKRTVLEFLLSPVQKAIHEAARER